MLCTGSHLTVCDQNINSYRDPASVNLRDDSNRYLLKKTSKGIPFKDRTYGGRSFEDLNFCDPSMNGRRLRKRIDTEI